MVQNTVRVRGRDKKGKIEGGSVGREQGGKETVVNLLTLDS